MVEAKILEGEVAAGMVQAWRAGDAAAAAILADFLEEQGNPEDLPVLGFRTLAAAGKLPFEGPPLEELPDGDYWRAGALSRPESSVVWTWLAADGAEAAWDLPPRVVRGVLDATHQYESLGLDVTDEELRESPETDWRYSINSGLVSNYGDPSRVFVSRSGGILEVEDFTLAVIVAGLGYEVAAGQREQAEGGGRR